MLRVPFFRQRPLTACALMSLTGILAGIRMPFYPLIPAAGLVCSAAWIILRKRQGRTALAAVCTLFLFAGALYGAVSAHPPVPGAAGKGRITAVAGEDLAPRPAGGYRGVLRDAVFTDETGRETYLGTLFWTLTPSTDEQQAFADAVGAGQSVSVTGRVYVPGPADNPYGFDLRLYLLQRGIRLGFSGCADGEVTGPAPFEMWMLPVMARKALSGLMDRVFGPSAPYPQALLLGERGALPDETRESFNRLGIAHVLAVSGLHVALLAGLVTGAAGRLGAGVKARFLISAVFLTAYCAVLGFPVSAVRASVLFVLDRARAVRRRSGDTLTGLSAALLIVLALFPLSVLNVGLWMTFGAVLGIHLVRGTVDHRLRTARSRALLSPVLTTVGAVWGMAVPSVMAYHSFSLWGLILSPLACAFLALLLPVYLIIFALGAVWLPAGQAAAAVLHRLLSWLPGLLRAFPEASLTLPSPSVWFIAGFVTVTVLLTRYVTAPVKSRLLIGSAAVVICLTGSLLTYDHAVRYIQFSMGQADAAVLTDGRETVVIDTGENGSDLAAWLMSVGRRPDTLILTHLHSDHCGGARQLLESGLVPGIVLLPEGAENQKIDAAGYEILSLLEEKGARIDHVSRGDEIATARARLTFLWPEKDTVRRGQEANLYSLAGIIDVQGVRLLFTGDLDGAYEDHAAVPADILKVAHHGSGGSTYEAFLDTVRPANLILTCESGRALPNINALARLEACGADLWRTDETGAVTVRFSGGDYTITPYLKQE